MRKLLDNWPQDGWDQHAVIQQYRLLLLRGLSVGAFIRHVEGGNR
jgi:asparagine synthase (glutamine-hydrolysing)